MCGIAGFARAVPGSLESIDPQQPGEPPKRQAGSRSAGPETRALQSMMGAVAHRGPDGDGQHLEPGVALGHRRLAILDLAGGAQPLCNEDGTVWVTFNGEIYNYVHLIAELKARGHRFRTRSDTEVLVHGYEEWGDDLVHRLRGMFAFGLWDRRRQRLLLVRDRLGIKPLYFAHTREGLTFASEAKALLVPELAALELTPDTTLDPAALDVYLSLRYVPGSRTLWRGIEKLPPAHLLSYQQGKLQVRPYWDLPLEEWGGDTRSASDLTLELGSRIDEVVSAHLVSDVPVGAFLSGGLDSSAVVSSMARHAGAGVVTCSVGYDQQGDDACSELAYARMVSDQLGTRHEELTLAPAELIKLLPEVVRHMDEPVADAAAVPLLALSRRARQSVTVVLSGEGADEVLAGYGGYRRGVMLEGLRGSLPLFGHWGRPLLKAVRSTVGSPGLRRWLSAAGLPLELRYQGVSRGLDEDERLALGLGRSTQAREWLLPYHGKTRGLPPLARMLYLDLKTWLPDDLLVKADKMTMAAGLELRVPFLDHTFVEMCWRLPSSVKLRGGTGKWLLRQAMKDRLPAAVLERPKRGFPVPTNSWLRGPLAGFCREVLLRQGSLVTELLPRRSLTRLLDEHGRQGGREEALFLLLMLELWGQEQKGLVRSPAPARAA